MERFKRLKNARDKKTIESLLFVKRDIVPLETIKTLFPKYDEERIYRLIKELMEDYETFHTCLEIIELSGKRFELKIKDFVANEMSLFSLGDLLKNSDVKALATIIYLQPNCSKKKTYDTLGRSSTSYKAVSRLKELNFIFEREGFFKLTGYFYDYFKLKEKSISKVKQMIENMLPAHGNN